MLTRGVRLLHDNVTPHTAGKTRETIEKMGWEILKHPPLTALTSHPPTSTCLENWKNTCKENVLPLTKKWKMKQETGLPTWTQIFILKLVSCWDKCLKIMWRNTLKVSFIFVCVFRKLELTFSFLFFNCTLLLEFPSYFRLWYVCCILLLFSPVWRWSQNIQFTFTSGNLHRNHFEEVLN
jgi:hypothetical protein